MPFREDVSDEALDAVAQAMEAAGCPEREGPFGLYDYSSYGSSMPHRVRDFRTASNQGATVFSGDDPVEARAVYDAMTRREIASAAWDAVMALAGRLPMPAV